MLKVNPLYFRLPEDMDANVLVLAGDIITFRDYDPLARLLDGWNKPVLFVAGNHEYYTQTPMDGEEEAFAEWLKTNFPSAYFLRDESVSIDSVHFFGGTMWTHFNGRDVQAMETAHYQMNDFRLIRKADSPFLPSDTLALHERYVEKFLAWFDEDLSGPRVVISHHAPVINPCTQYMGSPLMPAFNSLDMQAIIEKHQPDLWIYGHTHECDDQTLGKTRIVSNQLGYPDRRGGFECAGFDERGMEVEVKK
ncbi:MAG: metallophosphoesterase [Rhodospirillales bacterium]|nr:metallophosphoesterase [Alphaproteobacteria bacterium]MCB9981252.1 metallophosphoesterase [Rhodospirillales bacterium]